jgi:hypothetical protein
MKQALKTDVMETAVAKILICSSDKGISYSLRHFLLRNRFVNLVFKPAEESLRSLIHTPPADIIITTDQVWHHTFDVRQIEHLRASERVPVIIWADKLNDKIMSAVSALKNVYFIKKSDDENVLIQTLNWINKDLQLAS